MTGYGEGSCFGVCAVASGPRFFVVPGFTRPWESIPPSHLSPPSLSQPHLSSPSRPLLFIPPTSPTRGLPLPTLTTQPPCFAQVPAVQGATKPNTRLLPNKEILVSKAQQGLSCGLLQQWQARYLQLHLRHHPSTISNTSPLVPNRYRLPATAILRYQSRLKRPLQVRPARMSSTSTRTARRTSVNGHQSHLVRTARARNP